MAQPKLIDELFTTQGKIVFGTIVLLIIISILALYLGYFSLNGKVKRLEEINSYTPAPIVTEVASPSAAVSVIPSASPSVKLAPKVFSPRVSPAR